MNKLWNHRSLAALEFLLLCAGSTYAATCGDSTHVSQVTITTNSKGQQSVSCVSVPITMLASAAPAPTPAPAPAPDPVTTPAPAPNPAPAPPIACAPQPIAATMTFQQALAAVCPAVLSDYQFGTGSGRNLGNLSQLSAVFAPYGIAGTTVIQKEWERYQTFNPANFVFTSRSLDLTATIPSGGGLWSGGINSGQIFTKQTFQPGKTGFNTYAFEVLSKIPSQGAAWPAMWFYTQQPGINDESEIDVEFSNEINANQNSYDWTGFNHGPGVQSDTYSIMTNQWVWHPGFDFAADYHAYQFLWTPTMVYKYVDGRLIKATPFQWTSGGPAQMIINLAVGTDNGMPGMHPSSLSEFPIVFSIDHLTIWGK